jgi:hypothetical protein
MGWGFCRAPRAAGASGALIAAAAALERLCFFRRFLRAFAESFYSRVDGLIFKFF